MIQLTDEEIIHALEHCEDCVGCAHCIYTHKNVECNNTNDAVKLIRRLQSDLETCSNIEKQEKATNYELRTQIERLTEENKKLSIKIWNYEQPARTPLYSNESMVNCNFVACYNENTDLKAKNAELQKQVDELKKYKDFMDACKLSGDIEIVMNRIKPYAILREKAYQQAVKDTAKEILAEIDDLTLCIIDGSNEFEKGYFQAITDMKTAIKDLLKEKYGVEAE